MAHIAMEHVRIGLTGAVISAKRSVEPITEAMMIENVLDTAPRLAGGDAEQPAVLL